MAPNQTECSKLEQRSVIKFWVTEKYKACEIHRKIGEEYEEACSYPKEFSFQIG